MTTDIAASPAPPQARGLQGPAVVQLVGAGRRACPGNPGGLPRRGRRGSSRQGSRGHHSLASPSAAPQAPLQRGTASSQAGRRAGWAAASGLGFVTAVAMTSLGSFGEAPSLFPASWTGGLSPWGPPFYTCEVGWNTPLRGVLWVSAQRGRHILHTDPHRPSRSCPPCPLETPATLRSPVLRAPLCLHPYAVDSPSSPEQGAALLGSASTGQVCGHTLGQSPGHRLCHLGRPPLAHPGSPLAHQQLPPDAIGTDLSLPPSQ
ncbi:uncharacterized protein LOC118602951 isoform X2 [Rousettus aegyptiacus]|uniref:uncharacterized protein LOC118602951 isoform X2 n=1 Tax=Rousettus aegyptiacus TaxID=9407 RepID=UPI00168CB0E6|nr:uncharacterized protein LOC118602951 isoform X2 [Rousettus aegyptiacus]